MDLPQRLGLAVSDADLDKWEGIFNKDELDSLRGIFQELHASNEGPLRLEDLHQFIINNGAAMDFEEFLDQWRSIDNSGDGYVHEEEFLAWMAKAKGLSPPQAEGPQTDVPQAEFSPGLRSRSEGPRFSLWGSEQSLARRIKEEDEEDDEEVKEEVHHEETTRDSDVDMGALTADLENLREQLDNERQRRQDLEAELYDLAVVRDADMGGAVPIAEYEKLRLAEQLAQEKLKKLAEVELQQSEQRRGSATRASLDNQASKEIKRRSTLRRKSWSRNGRPSFYRRSLAFGAKPSRTSGNVLFAMDENEGEAGGNVSSSSDSDSGSGKSQISMSFKKEVRKKNSVTEEKKMSLIPAREQEWLKKEIQEVLSEMRSLQRVQHTAADQVAVSLADKVLTLIREDSVNVMSASDVANRAAQIVQEQRIEREEAVEMPLGAQVELADKRRNICSGLEDELADVQTQLRSCVAVSHMAVSEQSDLCERLAEQAKQLRLAVETLPPPFVAPVPPPAESINANALAESMAEHLSEQLASIHAETAEVKSAVVSAVTTLKDTVASQQAVPVAPRLKEDKDYSLVFSFNTLGLVDRINEAAFMQEFRECLQNLGAKAAWLENIVLSREGGSLLASVLAPETTVRALEKLPLAGNVDIMGDVACVAPAVPEVRRLNEFVNAELQGLRVQLKELAAARPPTAVEPHITPGFEGLWTAVVGQDKMVVGFQSAGVKCRAEHWLRENGIRSIQELVFADGQENFLNALQLNPVHADRANQWLKRQTTEAMNQRVSEALIAACGCRERTKLEEALWLAEKANLQNDCQVLSVKAALREVREVEASHRVDSLEAAYKTAVPPASPEVVSYVLLISGSDVADEEMQTLCDEAAYRSWVKWVPDDLGASQGNPDVPFLRCQGHLKREVEAHLLKMPPALNFSFIFLSASPFAHCAQEKLVDVANDIKLEVAGTSQVSLSIAVCGFHHVEDCRRYLQEQAHQQSRLLDVLRGVETLRSELKQSDVELEEQHVADLQQRLGAELENVCAMRKRAEQVMSSLRLQHLEKEQRRLESDKSRSVRETEALILQASGASQQIDTLQAQKEQSEKNQKQQQGIEALQATNAKVSDYTRVDAEAAFQHADELIALVHSHVKVVERPESPGSQARCPMQALEATERPQGLDGQARHPMRVSQVVVSYGSELVDASERAATLGLSSADLEELLTSAVHRARERNVKLMPLSWATLQMTAKMGNCGSLAEVLEKIKLAVVEEAARSNISLVDIAASGVDGAVYCTARISDSTSVLAAVEMLHAHRWRAEGLREVLQAVGVTDLQIAPKWPLERIQAEIGLSYGYRLDTTDLFTALVPTLADSHDLYSRAWERACWEAPTTLQTLVQIEPMVRFEDQASSTRFKDQLLPISQGRERGLAEVFLRQGARNICDFMYDAAAAHRQLKNRLLPGASWSEVELNDMQAVPPGHVVRTWHSSSLDPAPCGAHYDPGLEREDRVLAAARRMMRALDVEPRLDFVFNTSRLDIVFESAECLRNAIDWLIKNLDVVWLENRFGNPSCLGDRGINIGIRWLVADCNLTNPPMRVHINEIQLSLKELHDKKREHGCGLCGEICSGLAKCGVQAKDLDDVWKLILSLLDCTDGRAAHNSQRHLAYVVELATSMVCRSEGSIAKLAKELVEEAALQAMAAGIAADDVNRMKTKLNRATISPAFAFLPQDADTQPLVQQLSREGAMIGTTNLPEPQGLAAWQAFVEDDVATMATPMSLVQSMREQLQILSEAVDFDDPASQQLSKETVVDTIESIETLELSPPCNQQSVFSEELLQLRMQIADLKEHAEHTEQLRATVLDILHASVEPPRGDNLSGVDKEVPSHGTFSVASPGEDGKEHMTDTLNGKSIPRRPTDKWHRQRQSRWSRWLRELHQGDSTLLSAETEIKDKRPLEEKNDANAEAKGGEQKLYIQSLLQRLHRQAPQWEADLRLRSSQAQLIENRAQEDVPWLEQRHQEASLRLQSSDTQLSEKEDVAWAGESHPEADLRLQRAETQLSEKEDVAWAEERHQEAHLRLQLAEKQFSEKEDADWAEKCCQAADLRLRSVEMQLRKMEDADRAEQSHQATDLLLQAVGVQLSKKEDGDWAEERYQDADGEQEDVEAHLQEEASEQISQTAEAEVQHQRHGAGQSLHTGDRKLDSKARVQEESMTELLQREERLRQEARLERVLQRLQERLVVQERSQTPLGRTRTARGSRELVQESDPKVASLCGGAASQQVQFIHGGPQTLPCPSLPHLQFPEPQPCLRPMLPPSPAPQLLRLQPADNSDIVSPTSLVQVSASAREPDGRLGITRESSFTAAPATPPPAVRDERPRSQGSTHEISPRGLPSLRPSARFAERANMETHGPCGARNIVPLDISAVATA